MENETPPQMGGYGHVISGGIGWMVLLLPVALLALTHGLPYVLDVLGWLFGIMRGFADAVRG